MSQHLPENNLEASKKYLPSPVPSKGLWSVIYTVPTTDWPLCPLRDLFHRIPRLRNPLGCTGGVCAPSSQHQVAFAQPEPCHVLRKLHPWVNFFPWKNKWKLNLFPCWNGLVCHVEVMLGFRDSPILLWALGSVVELVRLLGQHFIMKSNVGGGWPPSGKRFFSWASLSQCFWLGLTNDINVNSLWGFFWQTYTHIWGQKIIQRVGSSPCMQLTWTRSWYPIWFPEYQ